MRRYDVVTAILLILSIIDFALASPVLVQEKRAGIDVVHMIPKDVTNVLGKRTEDEFMKVLEELGLAEMFRKKMEDVARTMTHWHASSSSAPLGPGHVSTNVAHVPEPNKPTYNSDDELGLIYSPTPLRYSSSPETPKFNPNPNPETDEFDRMSLLYHPPPKLTLPKKFGQADEPKVEEQKPGPSKPGPSDAEPSNQG